MMRLFDGVISVGIAFAVIVTLQWIRPMECLYVPSTSKKSFRLSPYQKNRQNHSVVLFNTGGWGIGPQRELTPEEFATGGAQNKKYFEGYQIRNRGEFMRQVASDKEQMIRGEIDELLGVAAAAGLKIKDPKERLNKFDPSFIAEDEEDLDVSVQWIDPDARSNKNKETNEDPTVTDTARETDSITRLDEDTGALGVW
jgi:hypothetical protein